MIKSKQDRFQHYHDVEIDPETYDGDILELTGQSLAEYLDNVSENTRETFQLDERG